MKIGYARVSTKLQISSLHQQVLSLKNAGCEIVYSEIITGSVYKRPELNKLLNNLESCNTLVVTSIDRLGRSLQDLLTVINRIKQHSVNLLSLKEEMNTATHAGMLMFNMIASVAEFERMLIVRRIQEGVQRAKSLGKYKGRVFSQDRKMRMKFVNLMKSGKEKISDIAKMANVCRQTLYNWKAKFDAEVNKVKK